MRFKVGDKVRIKKNLIVGEIYGNSEFVIPMEEYEEQIVTIASIGTNYYDIEEDNGFWAWTDEMLEPVEEGEKNNMNIEELNLEYKNKMDALMEEYKAKVKEIADEEEPFIKKGQGYFVIDDTFGLRSYCYTDHLLDKKYLNCGNIFPYTEENEEEVRKEVELIAERKKLQSEMEMFARLNNDKIDWSNNNLPKWFLCNWQNNIETGSLCVRYPNIIYFSSEEIAEKALKKFGARLKELYIDAESNLKVSEQQSK